MAEIDQLNDQSQALQLKHSENVCDYYNAQYRIKCEDGLEKSLTYSTLISGIYTTTL